MLGGLTGNDISEKIREAYAFVANNYDPFTPEEVEAALKDETKAMDEIVILGFSRGAYTARAISSIITDMGLLTRKGMELFWNIFTDWVGPNSHTKLLFHSMAALELGAVSGAETPEQME